jgi:hypothetical protein
MAFLWQNESFMLNIIAPAGDILHDLVDNFTKIVIKTVINWQLDAIVSRNIVPHQELRDSLGSNGALTRLLSPSRNLLSAPSSAVISGLITVIRGR